ncbi:MAG TPA: glycosyltransferase [Polyangiaceae bacterium]|jgi:hypothetical protein|nr:glycosyltransferase [Polyangiaceae bacterium]
MAEHLPELSRATVRALWIGDSLGPLERLSIRSFLAHGYHYELYTYGAVSGVPDGVDVVPAETVLPASRIFKYADHDSYAGFSNHFRYRLLFERGGIWADCDVVLLRPLELFPGLTFATEESPGNGSMCATCLIAAPPGDELLGRAMEICDAADVSTLKWGQTGPGLLTRLVRESGRDDGGLPIEAVCPVSYLRWEHLVSDDRATQVAVRELLGRAQAVHLWREMFRRAGMDRRELYPDGSAIAELQARYGTGTERSRRPRIAVVASSQAADTLERVRRAAVDGEVTLVSPDAHPGVPARRWSPAGCELAAPSPSLIPGAHAFAALAPDGDFDEIRCTPESAWALAASRRSGGKPGSGVLVVEVTAEHAALARPCALGDYPYDVLAREVELQALRDADRVEGDASALSRLSADGVVFASPRVEPAWPREAAPSISAVVTHKDLHRYLPECLASLRAQTVPVEIIVVDDGSGEEGLAVLAAEERKDPSLRVLRRANGGLGDARNFGVKAAMTELVLIVDADNVLRPQMAERLRDALGVRPDRAAATCAFRCFDEQSATLYFYCPAELSPRTLFFANTGGDACSLHRRETLLSIGYSTEREISEDWDLWLRYAERGLSTTVVPEVLFDYRVREDSLLRARRKVAHAYERFRLAELHSGLLSRWASEVAILGGGELFALSGQLASAHVAVARANEAATASLERAVAAEGRASTAERNVAVVESNTAAAEERAIRAESALAEAMSRWAPESVRRRVASAVDGARRLRRALRERLVKR